MAQQLNYTINEILRKANTRLEPVITPMEALLASHLNHKRIMEIQQSEFDGLDALDFNPVTELGFSDAHSLQMVD